jgi:malate dehydrogenase
MALQKYSGLPKNKVIGMAGILDTSRFKFFISQELNVPIKEVDSFVLGGHGDTMVPVPNRTIVSGKSLMDYVNEGKITSDRLDEIIDRTRKGGAEVVKLLQTGSAFYGPAASGVEMAESYLKDQNKTLPCAAYLNGEYGINDLYVGVPVVIGANGIQKVVELDLDVEEKKHFDISIDAVKELFDAAKKIDPSLI